MARLIKRWGKGKYGLWSTICDGYVHEPKKATREEIIDFMVGEWREDLEKRIEHLKSNFPHGWVDKDTLQVLRRDD